MPDRLRHAWAGVDRALRVRAAAKGCTLRLPPALVVGVTGMAGGAAGAAFGPWAACGGALAGGLAPVVTLAWWPERHPARVDAQVPALLDAVARSLRGGRSLVRALADAANGAPDPLGADARAVVLRIEAGVPLRDVLRDAAAATDAPSWRTALVAIDIAHDAGGPQAMALDALAAAMRGRLAAAHELRALTTPVRVSAALIAAVPLVVFGAVVALDPATARAATGSGIGRASAALGVVFDALGFWWIHALTRPR